MLVCTQKPIAVLGPQRLLVAVLRARQRHAEDPRPPPPALGFMKRRRALEEINLSFLAGRMFHDVDQLRVLLFESPHVAPHRGVLVRVGFLLAQVLEDALRGQPLAKTSLDLLAVRLGHSGRPVRVARAGRQVGRIWFAIPWVVARRLGAGGQVGRFCPVCDWPLLDVQRQNSGAKWAGLTTRRCAPSGARVCSASCSASCQMTMRSRCMRTVTCAPTCSMGTEEWLPSTATTAALLTPSGCATPY